MRIIRTTSKTAVSFLVSLVLTLTSFAQTHESDSLKQLLAKEKAPQEQFRLNQQIAGNLIENGYPDSVPNYIKRLYDIAGQQKNDTMLLACYFATAARLDYKTDSKEELEYILKELTLAEEKIPQAVPVIIGSLTSVYNDLHQFDRVISYGQRALPLLPEKNNSARANIYFQIAFAYYSLNKPDSTLHYGQLAEEILRIHPLKAWQPNLSALIGDAYALLGNNKVAEAYYQNAIAADTLNKSYAEAVAAGHYSRYLLSQHRLTEAKQYGLKGLSIAISAQAKSPLLENVGTLRRIYETAHQTDSAYYFAGLELAYRDSLFNQDKLNAVQDMTFKEEVRQHEEAMKKAEEDLHRKLNLQYAGIAFGLVCFVILFFLFSHTAIANRPLIRFLGVIALLIVFEFINLLIHPYLALTTNDSPLLMLLVMVCIAALLIPLHHKLEYWVTNKLVEKNNRIRLAAAKETIEKLEGNAWHVRGANGTNPQA